MTKEGYLAANEFFLKRKTLLKATIITQKICEIGIYVLYPLFLLFLAFVKKDDYFIRSAAVCAGGFLAVSFLRRRINAERPYEKFGFTPLIKKETKGCSFPSRHTFSAAIIAVNIGVYNPPLGIIVGVAAIIIAFLRVVLGVHFVKDTLFGLICGGALGLIVLI